MKYIFFFFLWLMSLGSVIYVEYFRGNFSKIQIGNNYLDKLYTHSFYKIIINSKNGKKLIGYENEIIKKKGNGGYKYLYNIKLTNINNIIGDLSAKGQIIFDKNQLIESFEILFKKQYLITGKKEKNKIRIYFEDINNPTTKVNKLLDNPKLDFFLLKTLAFRNLKIGENYMYEVISPSFLQDISGIKKQKLKIQRENKYTYKVGNNIPGLDIDTIITYNKDNELVKEKIYFIEFILIKDKKTQNNIIKTLNNKKEEGNIKKNYKETDNLGKKELENIDIQKDIKDIKKLKKCNLLIK